MNHYEYWTLLHSLRVEYDKQYTGYYEPTTTGHIDSYDKYIENIYGIKMWIHDDGMIDGAYEIVDEGKYAWCILKHK